MVKGDLKNYSKYIDSYIKKILNNEIEHCEEQEEMIKNIVIPVLERDDVYLDEKRIEEGLKLQKYFPFRLIEWEIFLFALIAGLFFKETDEIFFKVIRIYVGRGSGKNGFIDFLAFYFLSPVHGIYGYNVDLLANSEDQCKVSFNDVHEIINEPRDKKNEKALKANFYSTKEIIVGKRTKSELRFNTSSKRGKDSKRTGAIIFDEKHEYLSSENMNTLKSGLGKVPNGREITISTDGHVRGAVFDKEKEQSKEILSKYCPNNRTLIFWCRLEKEEEWQDENKWIKAIPSINDFPDLRSQIRQEVIDMPANMDFFPEFMAKRMNLPIGDKDVEVASWDDILATNQLMLELKNYECVGGIDYAMTNDFVACVLLFKANGKYYVKQHTFVCAKSRDLPGIKAPIKEWEEKGDLEIVNDVEISPTLVANWFNEQKKHYKLRKIAIDSFRYSLLNSALKEIGFEAYKKKNVVRTRPSDIMRAAPIINSAFINHNLVIGDVPLMRWYINNTKKELKNGNVAYEKIEQHYRKTDGFMALAAAFSIEEEIKEGKTAAVNKKILTIVG